MATCFVDVAAEPGSRLCEMSESGENKIVRG